MNFEFVRIGRIALVSFLVVSTFACASKKKATDEVSPTAGVSDGGVTTGPGEGLFDRDGSDSGKISGLNTIFFEYDKADITSESRQVLAQNAQWIKDNPKVMMQIEGHCDARGSVEYNLALGERRAKSVKTYLVGLGIDSKRLSIMSYGEEKPLVPGDSEAAYAKNRRANFLPLPQ